MYVSAQAQSRISPSTNTATTVPKAHAEVHNVAVMGDSLVFLATNDLQSQLNPKYPNPIIQGGIGVTTESMRLAIEQLHDGSHPDAIVIALGTNDVSLADQAPTQESKTAELQNSIAQQAAVLQTLADTPCVIWVGVQEHNFLSFPRWGPQLNAGFSTNIAAHSNAHFLDWEVLMKPHPEWQDAKDGLHFSSAGNAAYAVAITNAISQLC